MPAPDQDLWRILSPYLDQALTLPESERVRWLEALKTQHPTLAEQLQPLLEAHAAVQREDFLNTGPELPLPSTGLAGQTVGAYKLVSLIGIGGMGTVWLAERSDGRFQRKAAVKFLSTALMTREGYVRFKREGAILGRLSHPNIAELLDAGVASSGHPYIVLENVEGSPIDRYCDEHHLTVPDRIRLFLDVLSAVSHAHANLIVHRDLKPSNVLVSNQGQVKLLDFGIAKLLEGDDRPLSPTLTRTGAAPLTPEYAAPEQLTGDSISTATDIYALGVLLYLILSGQHPIGTRTRTPAEILKAIIETEPSRLSNAVTTGSVSDADSAANAAKRGATPDKLRRLLQGDLDTIVAKALKKDPRERYKSVAAMAEDLQRYLKHEPISARPDTIMYRTAKFVRRNRAAVALVTVALVAVIAGATGTLFQARAARRQRDIAYRQLARAERVNDLNRFLFYEAGPSNAALKVGDLLDRAAKIVEHENYSDDPVDHVELLMTIGSLYSDKDLKDKASPLLSQAYQLSRGMQDRSARAKASCAQASVVGQTDYAQARLLIEEGLRELPGDAEFALDRVFCLMQGSAIATDNRELRDALALDQAAERAIENSRFRSDYLKAQVLQNLAFDYADSQQGRAITALEQQELLWKNLGYDQTDAEGSTFTTLGFFLNRAGRPLDAERSYLRSREIFGEGPWWQQSYAEVLRQLGRLDEAARYSDQACARADREQLRGALRIRARIYLDQNNPTRAEETFSKAESLVTESTPRHFVAELISDRALLAKTLGKISLALQLADKAVMLDEQTIQAGNEGVAILPILLNRRSAIEAEAGQPDKAKADADRSLSLLQASLGSGAFSLHIGAAQMVRGRVLLAQGQSQEARAAFRTALEHFERTLGPDHPDTRAARQSAGSN